MCLTHFNIDDDTPKIRESEHEIIPIRGSDSDEDVTKKVRGVFSKLAEGKYGKKVLFKFEEVE